MADAKISALTEDASPTSDDLTVTVNDPGGTPANRKVTLGNLITKAHGLSDGIVKVATGTMTVVPATTASIAASTDKNYVTDAQAVVIGNTSGTNTGDNAVNSSSQPLDSDLTTIAGLTATSDNILQSVSSAWASRTPAQVTATLPVFVPDTGSGGAKGLAPATSAGDATKFLKGDGTWGTPAGSSSPLTTKGDVYTFSTVDARLGVGTDGQILTADSTQGTGLKWSNPAGGGDALTASPLSQFAATTSAQLAGVISDETGSGALVFATSPTLVTPLLGTPTSGTLTNCTGLPATGLVADTTTAIGVGSVNLGHASDTTIARVSAGVVSIEGVNIVTTSSTDTLTNKTLTSPIMTTPTLGVASATSINKVAVTAPATSSTLTVADGKTLTASNTVTLTGTDGVSINLSNAKLERVQFSIDGGGSVISTGQKGTYPVCVYSGTITAYTITVDTGTCTAKFWKKSTGTAIPTVSDNINTSGVSISSGTVIRSTTVSDFTTTTVTANDIFALNLTAVSGATKIFVCLEITRT